MIAVSSAFETLIKASPRRIVPRVTIVWTDPSIDESLLFSSNDDNRITRNFQTADLIEISSRKWAHLDGVIKADGSYYPCPTEAQAIAKAQMGWYGATRCNGSGIWSGTYPTLTLRFAERAINTLLVYGDSQYNEYPVDFDVKIYGAGATTTTTGESDPDVLLYTKSVTGNALLKYQADIAAQGITAAVRMDLVVKKWSAASRVVKITEFYTSISATYTGDEVKSLSLLEEREIRDGTIPIGNISANQLELELNNISISVGDGQLLDPFFPSNTDSYLHTFVKKNRKVTAELGLVMPDDSIEYVTLGTFWTGDWTAAEKATTVSTSCRDRMELLRKAEYDGSIVQVDATLYDLMEDVLEYAKTAIPMPDLQYQIDTELQNFTIPYGWFQRQPYFETIRQIVEACMGQAYISRNDVLIIEGPSAIIDSLTPYEITKNDYFDKTQPAKSEELINSVSVKTSPLIKSADATAEVYRSDAAVTIAGGETQVIDAKYSSEPVSGGAATLEDEGVGVAIIDEQFFAWGARITITNTGTASSFVLVITGYTYADGSAQIAAASDTSSISENGLQKYEYPENLLIQELPMAQDIADTLLASYKTPRKDVSVSWRGDPAVELADVVEVPEYQKNGLDIRGNFAVYKNTLDYDGTLKATTEGRKLS